MKTKTLGTTILLSTFLIAPELAESQVSVDPYNTFGQYGANIGYSIKAFEGEDGFEVLNGAKIAYFMGGGIGQFEVMAEGHASNKNEKTIHIGTIGARISADILAIGKKKKNAKLNVGIGANKTFITEEEYNTLNTEEYTHTYAIEGGVKLTIPLSNRAGIYIGVSYEYAPSSFQTYRAVKGKTYNIMDRSNLKASIGMVMNRILPKKKYLRDPFDRGPLQRKFRGDDPHRRY